MWNSAMALLLPDTRYSSRVPYEPVHNLFAFSAACIARRLVTLFALYSRIAYHGAPFGDIVGNAQRCPRLVSRNTVSCRAWG
jgi:hypothetical protein